MKHCNKCNTTKEDGEFNKKARNYDKLQSVCRDCNSKISKAWYDKNKRQKIFATRTRKQETALWLREFKSNLCCIRCGESRPACLDFHHKNPKEKDKPVSQMVNAGMSRAKMIQEIEKCDVLCANCHRVLHDEEKHGVIGVMVA